MSLKNVLSFKKYCFLRQTNGSSLSLTPLSQQIKQNIANEWIKCINRLPSVEVFITPFLTHLDPIPRNDFKSLKPILDNYNTYYQHWSEGSTQSIGIIQRYICLKDNNIFNQNNDCLLFALFCRKQESLYWFQKLQGIHNQWFKNLSKSPLKSNFLSELKDNNEKWILKYKTEELNPELETIKYLSQSLVEKKFGLNDFDIISCDLDLDHSLVAFLCDAFTQKVYKNGKSFNKMKLHSSIAPFKIAFTFRDGIQVNDILIDLTNTMIEMLVLFDIPVLPFTPHKHIPIESYDELGIPLTVIIDDESTRDGVIGLRNRDTDTEERVHISRLQQTVCLSLNLIHPSVIRNK